MFCCITRTVVKDGPASFVLLTVKFIILHANISSVPHNEERLLRPDTDCLC